MSKRKHKLQRQRVFCPICFEEDPSNPVELQAHKRFRKTSVHPLVITKAGDLMVDYGFTVAQETSSPEYELRCPKCKLSQKFTTPLALLEEVASVIDTKTYGVEHKFALVKVQPPKVIGPKESTKEEALPKLIRISNRDTVNAT